MKRTWGESREGILPSPCLRKGRGGKKGKETFFRCESSVVRSFPGRRRRRPISGLFFCPPPRLSPSPIGLEKKRKGEGRPPCFVGAPAEERRGRGGEGKTAAEAKEPYPCLYREEEGRRACRPTEGAKRNKKRRVGCRGCGLERRAKAAKGGGEMQGFHAAGTREALSPCRRRWLPIVNQRPIFEVRPPDQNAGHLF